MDADLEAVRVIFDAGEPVIIRVRHELAPSQQRLLGALGAGYVVEAEAPACAVQCGHAECRVSADTPTIIGRHRASGRAANLGQAVPVGRRLFEDPPVEKSEPKSSEELRVDEDARRDAQPVLTLCGLCEDFQFNGPAGEGRELARTHREAQHPEACVRRARGGRRIMKRANRTAEANAQIKFEADEARRLRAEREDAERLAKVERGRQRDALAAMDAGEAQERVLDEATAVGHDAVSGSAVGSGEPERAAASSSTHRFGLKKFGRGYIWTREAAISAVREYHEAVGSAPSLEDARHEPTGQLPSQKSATDLFGGWPQLLQAAGYEPRSTRLDTTVEPWTRERIIEAIQRWASEHGKPPASAAWKPKVDGYPAKNTVLKKFGSWAAAVEAAGFERPKPGRALGQRLGRANDSEREPQVKGSAERPASPHTGAAAGPASRSDVLLREFALAARAFADAILEDAA